MSTVKQSPLSVNSLAGVLHSLYISPDDQHIARFYNEAGKLTEAVVTADEFYTLFSANHSRLDYQEPGYYSFDTRAAEDDLAAVLFQAAQMEVVTL